jgi:outer membrane protein OmpA-like peptidoglycan-associated protein
MKHLKSILVAALILLVTGVANAQDKNNPWAIEVGLNAVDTFPTGLRDGQTEKDRLNGNLFDEYFNVQDHYNILPAVSRVAVTRYVGQGLSMGVTGTVNKIEKLGRVDIESMTYYGLDYEIKYSFREMLGNGWFDPSIGIGGGYTWLGDGNFGTANGIAGVKFWMSESLAVNFQSTYKQTFVETGTKHFQHSIGVLFNFGGKDTDSDGVYDHEDACPETAGLAQFNGCPDTDLDGVEDREDTCPNTPGLAEFAGCPDTDADGVADPQDACPTVAGLASMNGCPDADADGVTNADDACPTQAGDKANKGCPWPDSDNDGVLDKDDECPAVVGTVANKGCPEVPQLTIEIMKDLNDMSKTILFDIGESTVHSDSYDTLQKMKDIMSTYSDASFVITGYTDNTGSDTKNQTLSEERAMAVKTYLESLGLAAGRLSTVGASTSNPVASNSTRAGRKQNRRVEVSSKE